MKFNCEETPGPTLYKLLTGTVIPRPIGWVSTINAQGQRNLAPFSFFNAVGEDPPHVMFSTVRTPGNKNKDTLNNVLATGEFVVNLVTREVVEKMNTTSGGFPPEVDEFQVAGLTPVDSDLVKPPRVRESLVNFECRMVHHYFLEDHKNGGACVVIGRILMMHVHDSILMENARIDLDRYHPVARLAGANYAELGEVFSIKRPE